MGQFFISYSFVSFMILYFLFCLSPECHVASAGKIQVCKEKNGSMCRQSESSDCNHKIFSLLLEASRSLQQCVVET